MFLRLLSLLSPSPTTLPDPPVPFPDLRRKAFPAYIPASPERLSLLLILSLAFSVPPVFSTPSFPVHPARPFYTVYAFYHLPVLYSISNPKKPHKIIQTLMDVWQTFHLFCPINLFYHFHEFHQPFPLICSSLTILNRRFKLLLISP